MLLPFAMVIVQCSVVASSGAKAREALAIAEKTVAGAQRMADSVLGNAQADHRKSSSSFLEVSGALSTSALMAKLSQVENLAAMERTVIESQQDALSVMQKEQSKLALREDALEKRLIVSKNALKTAVLAAHKPAATAETKVVEVAPVSVGNIATKDTKAAPVAQVSQASSLASLRFGQPWQRLAFVLVGLILFTAGASFYHTRQQGKLSSYKQADSLPSFKQSDNLSSYKQSDNLSSFKQSDSSDNLSSFKKPRTMVPDMIFEKPRRNINRIY